MFERVGNLAERVATNVSRRAFLGRLGRGALGLAAVIGGVLAFPGQAHSGGNTEWCCIKPAFPCTYYMAINNKTCPCGGDRVKCQDIYSCYQTSC
jgi:hypothetical protein